MQYSPFEEKDTGVESAIFNTCSNIRMRQFSKRLFPFPACFTFS